MVLELLVNPGIDIAYSIGGHAADLVSTYYFVKKDGIEAESENTIRDDMEKKGIGKTLLIDFVRGSSILTALVGLAYGIDSLVGNEENIVNGHHLVAYLFGSNKYLVAMGNVAVTTGHDTIAKVLHTPSNLLVKITRQESKYKPFSK